MQNDFFLFSLYDTLCMERVKRKGEVTMKRLLYALLCVSLGCVAFNFDDWSTDEIEFLQVSDENPIDPCETTRIVHLESVREIIAALDFLSTFTGAEIISRESKLAVQSLRKRILNLE